MRGSRLQRDDRRSREGIIPAHAGLTFLASFSHDPYRDHPRACGAHKCNGKETYNGMGSSPRMRGSRFKNYIQNLDVGIIPAHAGLTVCLSWPHWPRKDHPRACGAHMV